MSHENEIVNILLKKGFVIKQDKTLQLTAEQVSEWYFDKLEAPYYPSLMNYLTRSPIRVLQLSRIRAIPYLRQLIGPTNPDLAREKFPTTIRALYGTNMQENAIHASDSEVSAEGEFNVFFGNDVATSGPSNTRRLA
ncbi:nucleoside diphosphate kinase [Mycotypha africana]|uniref:nucleoside diphosphate kinase n=1 Tax=Mycotypha africana TaxID=64632 RepID=UPI0023018BC4|nr:nucleoside diphosphate kinase [Mycotypha africana]KAI8988257.1 nucleoside diphosphate kinase [Mycotypha africana]